MNELLLFAKAPRAGFVKTRLGQTIGKEEACLACQELLRELAARIGTIENATVCFSPEGAEEELRAYFPLHWKFRAQQGIDLGARLRNALEVSLAAGAERVVVIGSDCPYVSSEDLRAGWARLGECDVVFGPAADGGYWLVGIKKMQAELFEGITWSADSVLEQSLARAKKLGLSVALLQTLSDVDTESDWKAFLAKRESGLDR